MEKRGELMDVVLCLGTSLFLILSSFSSFLCFLYIISCDNFAGLAFLLGSVGVWWRRAARDSIQRASKLSLMSENWRSSALFSPLQVFVCQTRGKIVLDAEE